MSCCKCKLFDYACLVQAAGLAKYLQSNDPKVESAINDLHDVWLYEKLGQKCLDAFCELKRRSELPVTDINYLPLPTWWVAFMELLTPAAGKVFKKYAINEGLISLNPDGTDTKEVNGAIVKFAQQDADYKITVYWQKVEKWLNDNAEANNITCWLEKIENDKKSCEKEPKDDFMYPVLPFTGRNNNNNWK